MVVLPIQSLSESGRCSSGRHGNFEWGSAEGDDRI